MAEINSASILLPESLLADYMNCFKLTDKISVSVELSISSVKVILRKSIVDLKTDFLDSFVSYVFI